MGHDTDVDVVPVTVDDPLGHRVVILAQNIHPIHRVHILANLQRRKGVMRE
jgi:hypothetical protein